MTGNLRGYDAWLERPYLDEPTPHPFDADEYDEPDDWREILERRDEGLR